MRGWSGTGICVWDLTEKQWVIKTGQSIRCYILYTTDEPEVYMEIKLEGQPNKPTHK